MESSPVSECDLIRRARPSQNETLADGNWLDEGGIVAARIGIETVEKGVDIKSRVKKTREFVFEVGAEDRLQMQSRDISTVSVSFS